MPDDLASAFCVPPDEPWFRAILAKLDDHIEDSVDIASNIKTAVEHGTLAHCAGALDALRVLRDDIIATRAAEFDRSSK